MLFIWTRCTGPPVHCRTGFFRRHKGEQKTRGLCPAFHQQAFAAAGILVIVLLCNYIITEFADLVSRMGGRGEAGLYG